MITCNTIKPYDEYYFCWVPLKCTLHRNLTIIAIRNQKLFGWLGFSSSFGKDSDDEVATEQLSAVVDVTFMPHNNPKIS